jgi:hypothetical protein
MRNAIHGLTLGLFFVAGCGSDEESAARSLALALEGVAPLEGGFHYEGWAILDDAPVTTGKFDVDEGGALVALDGTALAGGLFETDLDLSAASMIVITIEPDGDTDDVPTDTHYLAGAVEDGVATLSVGAGPALGDDFSTAHGYFILATPTDGNTDTDELSGVWFVDFPGSPPPAQGLTLPELPAGWLYEGWAVVDGQPVSTGRFGDPGAPDEAAPYSGSADAPPFPGEDFLAAAPTGLTFPTSLAGGMAVVSVEPDPDDSPAPFALKPLIGAIPASPEAYTNYELGNAAGDFPGGTATLE